MRSRLAAVIALTLVTWGATMGAAEARDPTPLPAEYPETGPTTTTSTIPIGNYPTVPPTTTTIPVTTTTLDPASGTTTVPPTTTVAPTPAPVRTPAPAPAVVDEPDEDTDEADVDETDEGLTDDDVAIYETAAEGEPTIVSLTRDDVDTYQLLDGPAGVELGSTGTLRWIPGEDAGGSTGVIQVVGTRDDGSVVRYMIRILVAEVNEAPTITAPTPLRGFPGKSLRLDFTATDVDLPADTVSWRLRGPAGMSIDDGTVRWDVPDDLEPGSVSFTITVTDDGEPRQATSETYELEIVDTSEAAVAAVDAEGQPVNPMVIAAADDAPPIMVDLDEPGALVSAMADRTPKGLDRVTPTPIVTSGGPIESSVIVESVQETFGVLLDLDVPTTAVAGGLVWQFALLAAPSLLSRRRGIFDIVGVESNDEIGDTTFRFRSDATGLSAGALRRRNGVWMRAVHSPCGPVWIPSANLRRVEAAG